ncbi:hypothetical protein VZT92_004051 [Zoarces viviparus]|uniref:Uncharacterized protein n=1 Tax=Zoarces viviparus TaxID=48416 RepID=A0AAW1FVS3_ZOAVI
MNYKQPKGSHKRIDSAQNGDIYLLHAASGNSSDRADIPKMNSSVFVPPLLQLLTEERAIRGCGRIASRNKVERGAGIKLE